MKKLQMPELTVKHLWLGVPVFLLVVKASVFPLPLLDFWWHLKMGQIILGTRSIPRTDIFSFTAAGKPFIVQNWLSEIILYLTYKLGGSSLLVFMNTLLLAAALIPVYYLCCKSSQCFWPRIFSASLVALCLPCNLRPQIFSFILFSICYLLLDDYRFQRRDRLWLVPLLMVLWANLHGGFILGLLLGAIYIAAGVIEAVFNPIGQKATAQKRLFRLAYIEILCILATLANPEGGGVYRYIWTVLQDSSSQQFVVEWLPPVINTIQGWLFYLPFFAVTMALILTRRRIDWTDLALYFIFSILGFSATRNSIYFLLVIAPIVSRYINQADGAEVLNSRAGQLAQIQPSQARRYAFLNIIIAAAAIIVITIHSPWIKSGVFHKGLLEPKTPVGAMNFIDEHSLRGNMLHSQIYGDYLIWRLWPRQHSFFDGRVHLFGESFFQYYQKVFSDSCWEGLLKKYDIRYLLLPKEDDSIKHMINTARSSDSWILLYEDEQSILFESRSKDFQQ